MEEGWDHPPNGRRQDYEPQGLPARESQRAGRRILALVHGLDAGPVDLGDVGRVYEYERDNTVGHGGEVGDEAEVQAGHAEPDHVQNQDQWHPPEEVRVRHGDQPEREEHGPGYPPDHGYNEGQDQDKDFGDHEDLHVEQESSEDRRQAFGADERLPEVLRAEKPLGHDPAPRSEHHDYRDDREEQHGARARYQDPSVPQGPRAPARVPWRGRSWGGGTSLRHATSSGWERPGTAASASSGASRGSHRSSSRRGPRLRSRRAGCPARRASRTARCAGTSRLRSSR